MKARNTFKKIQRSLARRGLLFSVWLFERMPYPVMKQLTKIFLFIGFQLTIRHRRVAKESLSIAFGTEKSEEEINDIINKCLKGFGRGMIELFYFMAKPHILDEKMTLHGEEHLKDALKKGKGVIAVTAHFGNFPLMMLYFAEKGYDISCIMRHTRDPELDKYLYIRREEKGLKSIYTKPQMQCVNRSLKALKRNGVLFIPVDQHFGGGGGVYVDFFGRKAATATGPIIFADKTDAVILPMFIVRRNDDNHDIFIEKPVDIDKIEDDKERFTVNMAKITAIVESFIRKYPQEWAWMHRRWKTQQ